MDKLTKKQLEQIELFVNTRLEDSGGTLDPNDRNDYEAGRTELTLCLAKLAPNHDIARRKILTPENALLDFIWWLRLIWKNYCRSTYLKGSKIKRLLRVFWKNQENIYKALEAEIKNEMALENSDSWYNDGK